MKKHALLLAAALCILFSGCGILQRHHRQNITGTWMGESVVGYNGISQAWKATLVLGEDQTFTLTYERDGTSRKVLMGNFTADLLHHPARIDFSNVGFSKGVTSTCCLAIAGFPGKEKMIVSGLFGKCGEIKRPEKFERTPSGNHQLYLELKKASMK